MTENVRVSRRLSENFDLVMRHYGVPPEEINEARVVVRRDIESAEICFAAMADRIRSAA